MQAKKDLYRWIICGLALSVLQFVAPLPGATAAQPGAAPAKTESIVELYEKAKKEGGQLNLYLSMATRAQEVILPAFEKRFPGIKVNHVDLTSDKLVARVLAEVRGGRVLGDIFGGTLGYLAQVRDQNLLTDIELPEAGAYPAHLKGSYWLATDIQYFIAGWNSDQVKKGDEPKQFEELAEPKWKNRLMAEPRDFQLLIGLAKRKYMSDENAIGLLKRIAANNVEFHKGHSQLVELLVAGQAAVCLTCYSHHFPPRMKKGAPISPMLTEGVGEVGGTVAVLKGAPHPNTALLWARWATSEEGQTVYAQAGETPAHPKVEPLEKTRPAKVYALSIDDVKEFPRYEKLWKEIFQLR
ncbi:MAG TPA: extracellular solute-binding protein [Candidatus Binatia bacterium]|jgi:iron(III) transport system substrate-binding protein|nr:extracellular solute-binding protein [Candidatus Binatia bacterium]